MFTPHLQLTSMLLIYIGISPEGIQFAIRIKAISFNTMQIEVETDRNRVQSMNYPSCN